MSHGSKPASDLWPSATESEALCSWPDGSRIVVPAPESISVFRRRDPHDDDQLPYSRKCYLIEPDGTIGWRFEVTENRAGPFLHSRLEWIGVETREDRARSRYLRRRALGIWHPMSAPILRRRRHALLGNVLCPWSSRKAWGETLFVRCSALEEQARSTRTPEAVDEIEKGYRGGTFEADTGWATLHHPSACHVEIDEEGLLSFTQGKWFRARVSLGGGRWKIRNFLPARVEDEGVEHEAGDLFDGLVAAGVILSSDEEEERWIEENAESPTFAPAAEICLFFGDFPGFLLPSSTE